MTGSEPSRYSGDVNTHLKSLILFGATLVFGESLGVIDARPIFQGLSIQTNKFDPPRIVFDQIFKSKKMEKNSDLQMQANSGVVALKTLEVPAKTSPAQILIQAELSPTQVREFAQKLRPSPGEEGSAEEKDFEWIQKLPPVQKNRLMYAQVQSGIIDQNWQDISPSYEERTIAQSDSGSKEQKKAKNSQVITGPILFDQVAWFPGVEVRAGFFQDGKAVGDIKVDMSRYVYEVSDTNIVGTIRAQVFLKDGRLIGEGSVRLNPSQLKQGAAPRLVVKAPSQVASVDFEDFERRSQREIMGYQSKRKRALQADTLYTAHREEKPLDFEGKVEFSQVASNSWGVLRTQSENFYPSLYLFNSSAQRTMPLFSKVMVDSLRAIVEMQRMSSEYEINGSVVIAKVSQDGRALSGVRVAAEAYPQHTAIYFNEFFLPDPDQTVTASHGYVAFLDLPEGLISLVAKAGESYLTHTNVLVDAETLSFAELESTLQKDVIPMVVSDAFTGLEQSAEVEGQSWPSSFLIQGSMNVLVPQISRLSLLKLKPTDFRFADSVYVYNDQDEFLDLKMIELNRLTSWKARLKRKIEESTGIVVVFSESENYEVHFPHMDNEQDLEVLFFDAAGNIVDKPVAFGGFITFGVQPGVQSVTLLNLESHLSKSKIIPVDPSGLVTTHISF